jgi:hypothetical protein
MANRFNQHKHGYVFAAMLLLPLLSPANPGWGTSRMHEAALLHHTANEDERRSQGRADPSTLATESLESCMARWDAGTHMSKQAWRETCRRITSERLPYVKGRSDVAPD